MKNKIVIFSNIKGGVGKTTLCALFASYLVERGYPVMAIDADLQASLYRHRKREKDVAPEAPIPWNVDLLDTANREQLELVMAKLKEVPGIVLIDWNTSTSRRTRQSFLSRSTRTPWTRRGYS